MTKWGIHFDIAQLRQSIEQLEQDTVSPDFWVDMQNSQQVLQKIKLLKEKVSRFESIYSEWEDTSTLVQLAIEGEDLSVLGEVEQSFSKLSRDLKNLKLETLLNSLYDKNNAILTLHAGAGGTESQDWVEMLLRMYTRWGESKNYRVKILDYLAGDEAGVKSATILVEGTNAYGYLRCEKGVHRLVRISPFDAAGKRHTSFSSVDVMPEIDDDIQIDINPEDLKIDTYRSGGAGGQHVNKTESAIRITHLPSGVIVQCQNERSQHQNKDIAMKMLKSKLFEIKEREQKEKIEDIKGVQKDIAWGSQIRSYVFHPYSMVKDHRTNFEVGNVWGVMDGDLDGLINAYLVMSSKQG